MLVERLDQPFESAQIVGCPRHGVVLRDVQTRSEPRKPLRSVVRLRAVVIHEYLVIASIAEEGAAERPDVGRCPDPARGLGVEVAELLQISVLLFGEKVDAHRGSHFDRAVRWLVLFPCLERFTVVTGASASRRTFCGTVAEDELAVVFSTNDIRFTARGFHSWSDRSASGLPSSLARTLAHAIPLCRRMFFSKRVSSAWSRFSCSLAFMVVGLA